MIRQNLCHLLTCASAPRNSPGAMETTLCSTTLTPTLCLMVLRAPITERIGHISQLLCRLFKTSVCSVLGLIILTEGPSSAAIKRCTQTRINPLCAVLQLVPFFFV
ncbi:hypothetical protein FQN60_004147 [Etheostoma spectabile]|uniref:Uncharacterized protein n=1 Tax=Etheostoma spectabile TaxID=54343 RepID=A0A5J5CX42_9PERO|nr:hypothetical protein FQN60_004147 [Etheostoma spectabile]